MALRPLRLVELTPHDIAEARRARALEQHQRVIDEAKEIARIAAQARNRAAVQPVFGDATRHEAARQRVGWAPAAS